MLTDNLPSGQAGKISNYLLYAIGEIVLVVLGILIALTINTWNQNRSNAQLEQELLRNLLSDIEIDIHNLQFFDSKKQGPI